jgi:hypothetical protein
MSALALYGADTPPPGEHGPRATESPSPRGATRRTPPSALGEELLDDIVALGMPAASPELPPQRTHTRPLVYATEAALAAGRRLLPPGVVLEREVAHAIGRGDVDASQAGGFVFLDHLGVVARCTRLPGRLRPRPRSWTVVDVERNRRRR